MTNAANLMHLNYVQTIVWLQRLKQVVIFVPLILVFLFNLYVHPSHKDPSLFTNIIFALLSGKLFITLIVSIILSLCLDFIIQSRRRQFIREARFPSHLNKKIREAHPTLSWNDAELVLRGLRQFFMAHNRSNLKFIAMPSQVVDVAWHEFILHTKAYDAWCNAAFGSIMHHTPASVLGKDPKRNDGLRRAWYWSCKEESINPRQPSRLPLLFALDGKFKIPGGFTYVPDCKNIENASSSDAYCGTSFGDSSSDDGFFDGDADTFGGSESSSDSGSGDSGDGCGGGGD